MEASSAEDIEMVSYVDALARHQTSHQEHAPIATDQETETHLSARIVLATQTEEDTREPEHIEEPTSTFRSEITALSSLNIPVYRDFPNPWTEEDQIQALTQAKSFSSDKYLRGKFLGVGGNSTVIKILRVVDLKVFAGKRTSNFEELRRESAILMRYRHEHILKFVELYQEGQYHHSALLVTEFCEAGTLQAHINHAPNGTMDRIEVLQVISQISSALAFLHHRRVYHSDVKPLNILLRQINPINVVLADLADLKNEDQFYRRPRGTPSYWSPHIARFNLHDGKADDVWALGITLLGMIGQWPHLVNTREQLRRYPTTCFNHIRVLRDLNPEHKIIALLCRMTAYKPGPRATAEECRVTAQELLAGFPAVRGGERVPELGIRSPDNFAPISFW